MVEHLLQKVLLVWLDSDWTEVMIALWMVLWLRIHWLPLWTTFFITNRILCTRCEWDNILSIHTILTSALNGGVWKEKQQVMLHPIRKELKGRKMFESKELNLNKKRYGHQFLFCSKRSTPELSEHPDGAIRAKIKWFNQIYCNPICPHPMLETPL